MKKSFVLFALVALAGAASLMSSSNGVAEVQNANRTGELGPGTTCNLCHGGGSFGATMNISVVDPNTGDAVDAYVPGNEYVLEFAIGHTQGTPLRYGFQATTVDVGGNNAGMFANPSSNVQLENVDGRHIVEHNAASTSNVFTVNWTAPIDGGDVTLYASGLAAGNPTSSSGDEYAGATLTLPEAQIVVDILGCTYDFACNYNADANVDDGSCEIASCATEGDINGDGVVNVTDLLLLLANFGT